jgi:hypothetical protein
MRSKCRTALLALVAILALGVVATASASAAEKPEFEKAQGELSGASSESLFYGETGNEYLFREGGFSGKVSSKTQLSKVILKFTDGAREEGCGNIESNTGLELTELTGTLGWISKAKEQVGLMFTGANNLLGGCANYTHSGNGEKRYFLGHVIGEIKPVNVSTQNFTLTFTTVSQSDEQLPRFFEGETESIGEESGKHPKPETFPLELAACSKLPSCHKGNWLTGIERKIEVRTNTPLKIVP